MRGGFVTALSLLVRRLLGAGLLRIPKRTPPRFGCRSTSSDSVPAHRRPPPHHHAPTRPHGSGLVPGPPDHGRPRPARPALGAAGAVGVAGGAPRLPRPPGRLRRH